MPKSRTVLPKPNRGGRPATGRDPVRAIRLSDEFIAQVDQWASSQDGQPGRSEAIRRLVEIGLSVDKPQAQTPTRISARAKRLAGRTIDGLADQEASTEEQADRKSDLLRGPEEFRNVRVDHRKKV
jgi:hypothetical protein